MIQDLLKERNYIYYSYCPGYHKKKGNQSFYRDNYVVIGYADPKLIYVLICTCTRGFSMKHLSFMLFFAISSISFSNYSMEVEAPQLDQLPLILSLKKKQNNIREEMLAMHITSIPETPKETKFFLNAAAYEYEEIKKAVAENKNFVYLTTKQNYSPLGLATIFYKPEQYDERKEYIQKIRELGIQETTEDKRLAFIPWWNDIDWQRIPVATIFSLQEVINNTDLNDKNKISEDINTIIDLLLPFVKKEPLVR